MVVVLVYDHAGETRGAVISHVSARNTLAPSGMSRQKTEALTW